MPDTSPKAKALPSSRIKLEKLNPLTAEHKQQFLSLLDEFPDVFTERPRLCNVGQHEIHVTSDFKPKRLKAYRVPEVLKPEMARQVKKLLDLGFIEPSNSEMASPIV